MISDQDKPLPGVYVVLDSGNVAGITEVPSPDGMFLYEVAFMRPSTPEDMPDFTQKLARIASMTMALAERREEPIGTRTRPRAEC